MAKFSNQCGDGGGDEEEEITKRCAYIISAHGNAPGLPAGPGCSTVG